MDDYFHAVTRVLDAVQSTQAEAMERAAAACAEAIAAKRTIFLFGTGHSHMLAEEPFYRAGGLVPIVPILETGLMLHEGAVKSTKLERLPGFAAILLEDAGIGADDVLFVISSSGINALPVEMATEAARLGAVVIALTSLQHSRPSHSRAASGRKLYELADIVLDNCGASGDAAVQLAGLDVPVGPTSTIAGAFIMNNIVVLTCRKLLEAGIAPPVFRSANVAEGSSHNALLIRQLREAGFRLRL